MSADPPTEHSDRVAVLVIAVLAVLLYSLFLPTEWTTETPLLWDLADHYGDAHAFSTAVREGDGALFRKALLGPDQYPPGYTIALGLWMSVFGPGAAAWLTFGLMLYAATAMTLARAHLVSSLLFLVSPAFAGIAPSLMVEPLAGLLLVAALVSLPGATAASTRRFPSFAAFGVLLLATVLTKYNVGLPLLPAGVAVALLTRDRRYIAAMSVTVAAVIAGWVVFLAVQERGWEMFRQFAMNRSNSPGDGPLARLGWYALTFRRDVLPHDWIGVALLAVISGGIVMVLVRRSRPPREGAMRLAFSVGYAIFALAALASHPYLLDRSLLAPALALFAGCGWALAGRAGSQGPPVVVVLLALAIATALMDAPRRAAAREEFYPPSSAALTPLSGVITQALPTAGTLRVLGTFNEFSAGWVRILQALEGRDGVVEIDATYPLEPSRSGWSAEWSDVYADLVEAWARDGTHTVVAIEVDPNSPFHTDDYRLWNAWKHNLVEAVRRSDRFVSAGATAVAEGVRVERFGVKGAAMIESPR